MTDKEKIKAIIKQYADKGKKLYRECCDDNESASLINYWDGYRDCAYNLLRELDDMQEEPTVSVWHDISETPTDKSKVIVWLGEELNEIVQCHYMYGKFVEKIPTEEYGRYVLVGNEIEGYSRQFVSNKKRADLTELVVKWAYIDDLIKL